MQRDLRLWLLHSLQKYQIKAYLIFAYQAVSFYLIRSTHQPLCRHDQNNGRGFQQGENEQAVCVVHFKVLLFYTTTCCRKTEIVREIGFLLSVGFVSYKRLFLTGRLELNYFNREVRKILKAGLLRVDTLIFSLIMFKLGEMQSM